MIRVALHAGHLNVDQAARTLPARGLVELMEFYALEPFGTEAEDHRIARLSALIGAFGSGRRVRPEDFMPQYRGARQRVTSRTAIRDAFVGIYNAIKSARK